MEFNEKLQQLRKGRGLTQEQLAEALFVSRTAISKWESGRGYPSIDSLKAISKLFAVSIDDLLSGEELIAIAETDRDAKVGGIRDTVFGVLDCMPALLLFLPFFSQKEPDAVRAVSLLALETSSGLRAAFVLMTALTVVFGIAELALQGSSSPRWSSNKTAASLALSALATLLFIMSPNPYAAFFSLCLLLMKGVLLLKRP